MLLCGQLKLWLMFKEFQNPDEMSFAQTVMSCSPRMIAKPVNSPHLNILLCIENCSNWDSWIKRLPMTFYNMLILCISSFTTVLSYSSVVWRCLVFVHNLFDDLFVHPELYKSKLITEALFYYYNALRFHFIQWLFCHVGAVDRFCYGLYNQVHFVWIWCRSSAGDSDACFLSFFCSKRKTILPNEISHKDLSRLLKTVFYLFIIFANFI